VNRANHKVSAVPRHYSEVRDFLALENGELDSEGAK
jgi:hypothetical protein